MSGRYNGWRKGVIEKMLMGSTVNVLHLVHQFGIGGAEKVLVQLINSGQEKINHIVCSFNEADELVNEINAERRFVVCLGKREGNDWSLPIKIAHLCRQLRISVVHAQGWATYAEGLIATKLLCRSKGFVFAFRGKTLEDQRSIPARRIYAQRLFSHITDAIITPSEEMRRDYAHTIGINPKRIRVIYNGVDLSVFGERPDCNDRRRAFSLTPNDFVVGCVARFDPVKDLPGLVRAFAVCSRKIPECHLLLVGDGSQAPEIRKLVSKLNIENRVILTGWRSDVTQCLQIMDIYVQPSIYEGISNAILEAMGAGLPVVSTRVGGTPEIIEHGRTGLLIEPQNRSALAEAIIDLARDPVRRKNMGIRGQEKVRCCFSVSQMVEAYERLFLDLSENLANFSRTAKCT